MAMRPSPGMRETEASWQLDWDCFRQSRLSRKEDAYYMGAAYQYYCQAVCILTCGAEAEPSSTNRRPGVPGISITI